MSYLTDNWMPPEVLEQNKLRDELAREYDRLRRSPWANAVYDRVEGSVTFDPVPATLPVEQTFKPLDPPTVEWTGWVWVVKFGRTPGVRVAYDQISRSYLIEWE